MSHLVFNNVVMQVTSICYYKKELNSHFNWMASTLEKEFKRIFAK